MIARPSILSRPTTPQRVATETDERSPLSYRQCIVTAIRKHPTPGRSIPAVDAPRVHCDNVEVRSHLAVGASCSSIKGKRARQ